MDEYIFHNFGEHDDDYNNVRIAEYVSKGWVPISHSTDRYWGLTIIFKKQNGKNQESEVERFKEKQENGVNHAILTKLYGV